MSTKIPPCLGGAKHSWSFITNRTHIKQGPRSATLALKGWYRCRQCNAGKWGAPGVTQEPLQEQSC